MACTAAAAQIEAIERAARPGLVEVTRLRRAPTRVRFPAPDRLSGHHDVIVVGGGQAGLAVSHCLTQRGVDHVVLERDRVLHNWRDARWDAFSLVTPNWQCALPGHPYPGDDPDGFMVKDEILAYVEPYANGKPIYEGVTVHAVRPGFEVETSHGTLTADQVVLAVGGYHVPLRSPTTDCPASTPAATATPSRSRTAPCSSSGPASPARRSPRTSTWRGAPCTSPSAPPRASPASTAAATASPGCRTWATTTCRSPTTRRARPRARRPTTTSRAATAGTTSTCARSRPKACTCTAASPTSRTGRCTSPATSPPTSTPPTRRWSGSRTASTATSRPTASRPRRSPATRRVWEPPTDGSGTLDSRSVQHDRLGDRLPQRLVLRARARGLRRGRLPGAPRGVTPVAGLYFVGLPWLHTWGSGRFAGIARDAEYLAAEIASRRVAAAA